MFVFLSYNGAEPGWALDLRESDFPGLHVYSPGLTLESQLEAIGDDLEARKPSAMARMHSKILQIEDSIWSSLPEALPTLVAADRCLITGHMIWRDLYLLVRADALIVDSRSTNELALFASLLKIPVVAVSYSPAGLHPWLTHCAQVTIHSPEKIEQILDALTPSTPNIPEESATEETEPSE